jgi:hypothetical protein
MLSSEHRTISNITNEQSNENIRDGITYKLIIRHLEKFSHTLDIKEKVFRRCNQHFDLFEDD